MMLKPLSLSTLNDLKNFYWLKAELVKACRGYGLSVQGNKLELIDRLEVFFKTGNKVLSSQSKKTRVRDSESCLTKNTLVKHYYNDAATRAFFVAHIGNGFKFNAYLRQFKSPSNITPNLTYGDLIKGYLQFEGQKPLLENIPKQFEYNQFIKDYFHNNKSGSLKGAISAWKFITSIDGPNTYQHYKCSQGL